MKNYIIKQNLRWLTPIILATQRTEFRRITVPSQPQANSWQDPILKKPNTKKGWWSGSCGRVPA
jgi:hypothetical protein